MELNSFERVKEYIDLPQEVIVASTISKDFLLTKSYRLHQGKQGNHQLPGLPVSFQFLVIFQAAN